MSQYEIGYDVGVVRQLQWMLAQTLDHRTEDRFGGDVPMTYNTVIAAWYIRCAIEHLKRAQGEFKGDNKDELHRVALTTLKTLVPPRESVKDRSR